MNREDAIKIGQEIVNKGGIVHFTFRCGSCGTMCSFTEPNTIYEYGECAMCGYHTLVTDVVGILSVHVEDIKFGYS